MEIRIVRPRSKAAKSNAAKSNAAEHVEKHIDTGSKELPFAPAGREQIKNITNELNDMIGLHSVKKLVYEISAFIEIQKRRQQEKLVSEPLVLHMIFRGNPGTGKTTVARILGKLFREMNVLSKGHLIEIERADLVGEYIGHTAQKTREQLKKSSGGILFIDEAYSLARGGEKDFGKEAIDTLVKAMEDQKDNLILILAGYNQEMNEFIKTNPGLKSRFPIHIDFPDYTIKELLQIADVMLEKRQYKLTPSARDALKRIIELSTGKGYEHSGNARLVRNLIEKAMRRQAVRLINREEITVADLMLITDDDIEEAKEVLRVCNHVKKENFIL
ncbi:AAA family ATPase [Phosphitispora fastidiosa]|uniref:AAA family ATPase n=1 Tax=Phosphitispora fastidiosa TaxID=2837202 RepID=UPI0022B1F3D8|nr:AAA family ATPase [Phosphitispora fastidiosa]MBU7005181.1 stage V sporulation protein K [Phosphitispora fastidiosa]